MKLENEKVTILHSESVIINRAAFEDYLKKKGWYWDANMYRSPDGGRKYLNIECLQNAVDNLAEITGVLSGKIYEEIVSFGRNQEILSEVRKT